ncbi:carbonic anhydrase [Paraoerskovia sediminicola]|nr:carbonic anhydrase [Paraoerskovia sediminicola]
MTTSEPSNRPTPREAWAALAAGNRRFATDAAEHPSQSRTHRAALDSGQSPSAVVLGCSDSRVPPELVLDQGLGEVFVVRTAGHVTEPTIVGSVEYGALVLGAPVVVVLGHESCGAVAAAAQTLESGDRPGGAVSAVVDAVVPSIAGITAAGAPVRAESGEVDVVALRRAHVRRTVRELAEGSAGIAAAVAAGTCAVVGAEYSLTTGEVTVLDVVGDIGAEPTA